MATPVYIYIPVSIPISTASSVSSHSAAKVMCFVQRWRIKDAPVGARDELVRKMRAVVER